MGESQDVVHHSSQDVVLAWITYKVEKLGAGGRGAIAPDYVLPPCSCIEKQK